MIPDIRIEDYDYPLPDERIAKYPLPERDASKLLRYRDGVVDEFVFRDIPDLLPSGSIMVFNDTKVVPARLHFQRDSGAHIEVFCLQPVDPAEYNTVFASVSRCVWRCVIGNSKRWKDDLLHLYGADCDPALARMDLKARLLSKEGETGLVEFTWAGGLPFSAVLEACGTVPIPPYLNREAEAVDIERYQTLYARFRGSVAAPTAGLHFTEPVLERIREKGITTETVCLHVGAGTFLPVKSSNVADHPMHSEPFVVKKSFIQSISEKNNNVFCDNKNVIAVGTTSVRTLESLYYVGVSCIETGRPAPVEQWCPYTRDYPYSLNESMDAILKYLDDAGLDELRLDTRIIIVPGFRFRVVDMLVTNFHQPESTLILLISAFVGGDWRTIYDYALGHGFRFLSYGDSSLLFRARL